MSSKISKEVVSDPEFNWWDESVDILRLQVNGALVAADTTVVVDSTDPVGPAEGLFNEAFYRECFRCLGPNGILVQQSESPLFHAELIEAMPLRSEISPISWSS